MQLLCSPRCSFEPQNRGPASDSRFARLRAGLEGASPPRLPPPALRPGPAAPTATPAGELDILSAYASPERIPKKRQGAYNTLAFSNEGRAFIVDNQTLEGEPAPNAELACGSCTSPWRSGSPGTTTSRYHHLGFAVTMTTDRAQLPLACGYISRPERRAPCSPPLTVGAPST